MSLVIIFLTCVAFVGFIIWCALEIHKESLQENTVSPEKPQRPPITPAEREAIRQADEAFDWQTHNAIVNGTYTEPLPSNDGFYWSNIYPDLYHTKNAGINFCKGIKNLAGVYFDALLIPDPTNKFDPNAIKIVHAQDKRKLGYIPADETESVRFCVKNQFPYLCRAHIDEFEEWDDELERERTYLKGEININRAEK